MCKYRNRLFEWNILSKIGFLLHGYSSKKFYWYLHYFIILILNLFFREFIFFLKKIVIIFIIVFVNVGTGETIYQNNGFFILILNIIFLWIEMKFEPFITKELNSLEYKATFTMAITIFGALFSSFNQQSILEIFIIFFLFGFNIYFIIIFGISYLEISLTFGLSNSKIFNWLESFLGKFRRNGIFILFIFLFLCIYLIPCFYRNRIIKEIC